MSLTKKWIIWQTGRTENVLNFPFVYLPICLHFHLAFEDYVWIQTAELTQKIKNLGLMIRIKSECLNFLRK